MKRAPIFACLGLALAFGIATTAVAQSKPSYQPVRRAIHAGQGTSSSEVQITPTTLKSGSTSIEIGSDHWSARGYDLKLLIAQIYDIDSRRIDLSDDIDTDARYDVTLALPSDVDEDTMQHMLQDALQKKFGLAIAPENRAMDVYVLTAPNGPGAELHRHAAGQHAGSLGLGDAGQITYMGKDCSGTSSGGISASAGTIGDFRRTLEPDLDRLLVDETHLDGSYDFKIGNYANEDQLFKLMHDQLGLQVTPTQRKVTVLTVRSAGAGQEMRAAL
jgi:uncharacterized protein (TIGR03435 family)